MPGESEAPVVWARNLRRRFRSTEAVRGVDLSIGQGSVFALLGPNGAGKTTTIKLLMGILRPSGGEAAVLGVDSRRLGRREFERIGYVSENQKTYDWMSVRQLLAYYRPLYPAWDDAFCADLLARFELPLDRPLRELSRGMRMKASLVSSLAYRPDLLVLDEPFGGLDPVVRQDFITGMLELTQQERWTILVSSHDIDDVERLADTVGILAQGRLQLTEPVDSLQQRMRRIIVTTQNDARLPEAVPSAWLHPHAAGRTIEFVHSAFSAGETPAELARRIPGFHAFEESTLSLKEMYLALARSLRA